MFLLPWWFNPVDLAYGHNVNVKSWHWSTTVQLQVKVIGTSQHNESGWSYEHVTVLSPAVPFHYSRIMLEMHWKLVYWLRRKAAYKPYCSLNNWLLFSPEFQHVPPLPLWQKKIVISEAWWVYGSIPFTPWSMVECTVCNLGYESVHQ